MPLFLATATIIVIVYSLKHIVLCNYTIFASLSLHHHIFGMHNDFHSGQTRYTHKFLSYKVFLKKHFSHKWKKQLCHLLCLLLILMSICNWLAWDCSHTINSHQHLEGSRWVTFQQQILSTLTAYLEYLREEGQKRQSIFKEFGYMYTHYISYYTFSVYFHYLWQCFIKYSKHIW